MFLRRLFSNKLALLFALSVIVVIGVVVFFIYRNTVFSTDILKLEIVGPTTAAMGDDIEYVVTYKNNGNFSLEEPKLTFELPENSLTEGSERRLVENLGDLAPGQEGSFKAKVRLLGKQNEVKTARVKFSYTPHNLSARYEANKEFDTKIGDVPIALTYDLPTKFERGRTISYSINYFSNVDFPLENVSIKLNEVNGFHFQSSDPASLDPNEHKLETLQKGKGGRITITGVFDGSTTESVTFSAQLGMWIGGKFIVIQDASQGVAIDASQDTNKVELMQTTRRNDDGSYAVVWHVKGALVDVKNVKVKALLSVGTTIGDDILPEDQLAHFALDSRSREIIWLVGDLPAGATTDLNFQVTPLPGQHSITQTAITAENRVTGVIVQGLVSAQSQ